MYFISSSFCFFLLDIDIAFECNILAVFITYNGGKLLSFVIFALGLGFLFASSINFVQSYLPSFFILLIDSCNCSKFIEFSSFIIVGPKESSNTTFLLMD